MLKGRGGVRAFLPVYGVVCSSSGPLPAAGCCRCLKVKPGRLQAASGCCCCCAVIEGGRRRTMRRPRGVEDRSGSSSDSKKLGRHIC